MKFLERMNIASLFAKQLTSLRVCLRWPCNRALHTCYLRLRNILTPRLHDTTGCQWVWQPVVSCKRGFSNYQLSGVHRSTCIFILYVLHSKTLSDLRQHLATRPLHVLLRIMTHCGQYASYLASSLYCNWDSAVLIQCEYPAARTTSIKPAYFYRW